MSTTQENHQVAAMDSMDESLFTTDDDSNNIHDVEDPTQRTLMEDVDDEDTSDAKDNSKALTYAEQAKAEGAKYTVTDVPPLPLALVLGVQRKWKLRVLDAYLSLTDTTTST